MPKPSGMEPIRFQLADTSFYLVPIAQGFEIQQEVKTPEGEISFKFLYHFATLRSCVLQCQFLFLEHRLQSHKGLKKKDLALLTKEYTAVVRTLTQFYEQNRKALAELHTALRQG